MGVSMHRLFVAMPAGGSADGSQLAELVGTVGLNVVDAPEPSLVTFAVRAWRDGGWLVIDDPDGDLLEAVRESNAWRVEAVAAEVMDSDVAVIERYGAAGRVGRIIVRPSGRGAMRRQGDAAGALFAGLLSPGVTQEELDAALGTKDVVAEPTLAGVFPLIGLSDDWEPPSSAWPVLLTDGRRHAVTDVAAPPQLWISGRSNANCLCGIEGQTFRTSAGFLTLENTGGLAEVLRVTFTGSALDDGLIAIDLVAASAVPPGQRAASPGGREVAITVAAGDRSVVFSAPELTSVAGAARETAPLAEHRARERWSVRLEGRRLRPGSGTCTMECAADGISAITAIAADTEITILEKEVAPSRMPVDEPHGGGGFRWTGLSALSGDRCLAATISLTGAPEAPSFLAIALERWASTALSSPSIEALAVDGPINGVRTLKAADVGRGRRWSRLAEQLASATTLRLVRPDDARRLSGATRTVFFFVRSEQRLVLAVDLHDLGTDAVKVGQAWRAVVDEGARMGVLNQATITTCDHTIGTRSRYEHALGIAPYPPGPDHLHEPGTVMYLPAALADRLDPEDVRSTFDATQVGALVRLVALPGAAFSDIERATTPILRSPP